MFQKIIYITNFIIKYIDIFSANLIALQNLLLKSQTNYMIPIQMDILIEIPFLQSI